MVYRRCNTPSGLVQQLYVPKMLREKVISRAHDECGHFGYFKTFEMIRNRFYWPGYQYEVSKYVKQCDLCERFRSPHPKEKLVHFNASKPFEILQWDMIGPLKETANGKRYILVVCDMFSKWAEAFPLRATDSTTISRILIDEIICRFGVPKQIHSDNGTNFTSEIIKNVCKTFGILRTNTTPYHPQGNGGVERMNGTLKKMIIKACYNNPEWDKLLPKLLFYYRCATHSSTGPDTLRSNL